MQWYIYLIWGLFGSIMLATALAYLYYLFKVEDLLDKHKSKDWRYDG